MSLIDDAYEKNPKILDNARDEKWSEWHNHDGKNVPLDDNTKFEYRMRGGTELVAMDKASDYEPGFIHKGCSSDIIAYRYKIKEPESDMHPDLEWLARNVSEWGGSSMHPLIFKGGEDWDYCRPNSVANSFTHAQWQAARQQLGLDQPEVTEDEEEAWQDKERQLIGGPRKAENFLHQAADLMAERGKQYDQAGGERSMGKAVAALNAITGRGLTEAEGWLFMSLVKRVRQHSGAGYHQDSAEDAVAYAALEAEALESAK